MCKSTQKRCRIIDNAGYEMLVVRMVGFANHLAAICRSNQNHSPSNVFCFFRAISNYLLVRFHKNLNLYFYMIVLFVIDSQSPSLSLHIINFRSVVCDANCTHLFKINRGQSRAPTCVAKLLTISHRLNKSQHFLVRAIVKAGSCQCRFVLMMVQLLYRLRFNGGCV